MKLFTRAQHAQLLANGRATAAAHDAGHETPDHVPVIKLFTPDANATWLITEITAHDGDLAFCLADLGMGTPELGYVSIEELRGIRGALGLPVERDLYTDLDHPISAYAARARAAGHITTDL